MHGLEEINLCFMVAGMESRRLEQLVLQLCCFAAITCCLQGGVRAQTTLLVKSRSPHIGAVERILLEVESTKESVLSRRTRRIDPLDHFNKYGGGYNITNKHYWSSAIFTGRSGYLIAAVWLFAGIVLACVMLISKKAGCNSMAYCSIKERFWLLGVVTFLTVVAIAASAVAVAVAVRFHSRADSIKRIIDATAEEATGTIRNVTDAVAVVQNTSRLYGGGGHGFDHLNSTIQALNTEAAEIQAEADKSMRLLGKGIKTLEEVTIVTVVLNLVAVFALLACRWSPRLHGAFCLFIICCWLLTALFWIYFGFYFFLDKFAGDTCIALEEYQLHPQSSTLRTIIPCSEKLSADVFLQDVRAGLHDIIDEVNVKIYTIKYQYHVNLDYDVCNPFSGPPEYLYQPQNCSSDKINIGDIPQILKRLTCSATGAGSCEPSEFISGIDYAKVETYTSSIQSVLDVFPGTERLLSCGPLKDGLASILTGQCAPLRRSARAAWASLATLAAAMAALLPLAAAAGSPCGGGRPAGRGSVGHLSSSASSEASESEMSALRRVADKKFGA